LARKKLTGMDRIRNDECRMMNDELRAVVFDSSFCIPNSSFLLHPVYLVHPV
jgi:hypothetical protein